jgi:DNA polymerase-3 subunit alpha
MVRIVSKQKREAQEVVYDLTVANTHTYNVEGIAVHNCGGSLTAYLMGITDVDPIRFGLLFERFINPSRNDLPDADLDFMSTRREEVIQYLEGKYGKTHVAGINNYGVLGSASSLKDVSRIYGLSMFAASKFIPAVHGQPVDLETAKASVAEIATFAATYPKIWKGALAVQGIMRSYGRHAAGTIVSGVPLADRAVVEVDGASRKVNWDMRVCEEMGLVKLDVLGLSTLDTLARCVRYIKERHGGLRMDLMRIPLDDAKTLQMLSEESTVGLFQVEGGVARRMIHQLGSDGKLKFTDIVAVNALNRPGPLDAMLDKAFIQRKLGVESVSYPHPLTKPALEETYGVMVYQEQIMKMSVDLCGFSGADADGLRKAIGKKDLKKMESYREQFIAGATLGTVTVKTDDGREVTVHRARKFKTKCGRLETIEVAIKDGLELDEHL